jgi:hypothetical protein
MKRGKEVRDSKGQPTGAEAPKEVPVLMFVMVEKGLGGLLVALRMQREDVLTDLRAQGADDTFLIHVDELYAEFRKRFEDTKTREYPN